MVFVLVRHKVEDYDKWKQVFDSVFDMRQSNGEKSFKLYRVEGEPNNMLGMFEWDSLENAKAFFELAELKEKMKESGVVEEPEIYFLNEA